jgi:K+-sensing histidine kinase KdpD
MVVEEVTLMMDQQPVSLSEPNAGFLEQLPKAEAARQGEQLRKALLDSVIHELRTPLTSSKASVTTLLTTARLGTTDLNELPTIIDEEADRLNLSIGEALERGRRDVGENSTSSRTGFTRLSILQEEIAGSCAPHIRFTWRSLRGFQP